MTFNSHNIDQSGMSVPQFHESMAEARRRISIAEPVTYEPGSIVSLYRENAGTIEKGFEYVRNPSGSFKLNKDGKRIRRPKQQPRTQNLDEAKVVESHVADAWDLEAGNATVSMKPTMGDAGKHYSDVVYNNPANAAQVDVIKNNWNEFNETGVVPMDKFQQNWEKAAENQSSSNKWKIKGFDEDGVWITGSKTGSAIVEGGVNYIAKYRNDGTQMAVMSDRHDFLENLPVVGPVLSRLLPKNKIAVTAPMETNIFRVRPTQFKDPQFGLDPLTATGGKKTAAQKISRGEPAKPQKDDRSTMGLLRDCASAQPQKEVLDAERFRQAGMLSGSVGTFNQINQQAEE